MCSTLNHASLVQKLMLKKEKARTAFGVITQLMHGWKEWSEEITIESISKHIPVSLE